MKFKFSPHIAFQVKDYEKAIAFYRDVLGMELVKQGENESHLLTGGVNFYAENSPSGHTFFEFQVDDMAEAEKILTDAGCTITQEYGEKSKMFADPYGMKFHIWSD